MRDFSAANSVASTGFHVQPFDDATGCKMLLSLVRMDAGVIANQEKALEIVHILGGLPLAIAQIGGFISRRKLPLQDFIPLYEKNAAEIDSRKTVLTDYEHTLSTVWEISLAKFSDNASTLLNLLAFFEPDATHELVLIQGSALLDNEEVGFLSDEMEYVLFLQPGL